MTQRNTELRVPRDRMNYGIKGYGIHSGTPTVSLQLSSDETNAQKISTFDSLFGNYNWKQKLQSGFARLRLHGTDPLNDELHLEGLSSLYSVIDPRFVDIEIGPSYIDKEPSRTVQNMTDLYSLFVPLDRDFDDDVFEYFVDQSRKFGNVEFVFEVDSETDKKYINGISRDYKIYDSDIYLRPKGRKVHTVRDNYETCVKMAKSHTWNVSPRMDVVEEYQREEDG